MRLTNSPPQGSKVPALDRGIALLRHLRRPLSAAELQRRLGIHRASVYRLLDVFLANGFVTQSPKTGFYALGPELMTLGYEGRVSSPLASAAKPLLKDISAATHHMSELAVYAGGWRLMMLDTWLVEGTPARIQSRAGMLIELHHLHAHGLCYLAFAPERRLDEYLRTAATKAGRRELFLPSPVSPHLRAEIERWRTLGYAWRSRTQSLENARVSVPVFNRHERAKPLIGMLGIVCDTKQMTALRAAETAALLKRKAVELERAL